MPYSYAYTQKPSTIPLPRQNKPKYGLLDLLSSPAALKVNEGIAYSDPDTGETFKEDPTISGQKAKLFGFIPYGSNPADEVNATLAYDQISGSAADKRNVNFQKAIGALDELRANADFLREETKRKTEHLLGLDKLRAEKDLAIDRVRGFNQAAKDFLPDLVRQIWATKAAETAGGAGRSFNLANDPNISAADQVYQTEQALKAQGATQAKNLAEKTYPSAEATALANAERLATESGTLLNAAQSKPGQAATTFGYIGNQAMPGAQALKLGEVTLGPGQISRQPLAPLFNKPGLSYDISSENRGPIPVETAVYNRQKAGDVDISTYGGTLKNLLYDAGQVSPDLIAQAQANLSGGQPGRVPASRVGPYNDGYQYVNPASAPTLPPTPAAAPAPAPAPRIVTPATRGLVTPPGPPMLDSRQDFKLPDLAPLPTNKQSKTPRGKQRSKSPDFSALISRQLPAATDTASRDAMKTREQRIAELIQSAKLERARTGVGRTSKEMTGPEGDRQTIINEINRLEKSKRTAMQEEFLRSLKSLISQ